MVATVPTGRIRLSSVRSASTRMNAPFSSSSVFKCLSLVTLRSPNLFLYVKYVALDAPIWQLTSTIGVTNSVNCSGCAICPSENPDLPTASPCAPSGLPKSNSTSIFEAAEIRGRRHNPKPLLRRSLLQPASPTLYSQWHQNKICLDDHGQSANGTRSVYGVTFTHFRALKRKQETPFGTRQY